VQFYRRNLPRLQRDYKPHFVTFVTKLRWKLPPSAREITLSSCCHDHRNRYELYVAVIMPDHVHLILTPLVDETRREISETCPGWHTSSAFRSARCARGRTNASAPTCLLFQQLPRDHQPLNLARPFANCAQLHVAVILLSRIVFDEPVPPMNLHAFIRAPHGDFAGVEFRHR
jgi:hypothetical protein